MAARLTVNQKVFGSTPSRYPISASDLHWLAGWLEGEGSFMLWKNSPVVVGVSTDVDVVQRVAKLFRTKLLSYRSRPKTKNKRYKRVFVARMKGRRAIALMRRLRSLMGQRRQVQIDKVLSRHAPVQYRFGPKEFLKMQKFLAAGWTHQAIADRFKVTRAHVTHMANGRIPKWLQPVAQRQRARSGTARPPVRSRPG